MTVTVRTTPSDIPITVRTPSNIPVIKTPERPVNVSMPTGQRGPKGDPGDDAQWDALTQAEYDALPIKDANTLYVIVEP